MIDGQVQSIVKELSQARGSSFFTSIVRALCRAIDADYVFISMMHKGAASGTTVAFCQGQELLDNMSYTLADTPCEDIPDNQICSINQDVQSHYPKATLLRELEIEAYVGFPLHDKSGAMLGHVVALFKRPIVNATQIESLFILFSGLIAGELERRENSQQLLLANSIVEKTSEGVFVTNSDNIVIYVNEAYQKITGFDADEVIGKPPRTWKSKYHDRQFYYQMSKSLREQGRWSGEIYDRRKDGSVYPQWLTVNAINSEDDSHYVGIFSDISQRKATEEKMFRQANFDPLTGLANRQHFLNRLEQIIALAKRHRRAFGVLFLDLDLFKSINDTLGHRIGDQLLIQVAKRIKRVIRETDIAARLGGDEFTIILGSIKSVKNTELVALKVIEALNAPFNIEGNVLNISASVGISLYPDDATSADELLNFADQAMYSAKQQGKNRFSFFTSTMQQAAERRMWLKNQLMRAIDEKEFTVVYQPIINIHNQKIDKLEALARWNCAGESVSPVEFIPVAEEFGLIQDIGTLILESACATLNAIHQCGFSDISLSINRSTLELSTRNNEQPDWLEVIRSHDLDPNSVVFEITESLLAPENSHQQAMLAQLREQGCHIAIDDFGTGYSSLSYLHRFPVDTLKIDRSFIMPLGIDDDAEVLVSTIIAMSKSLGITVVAEGVETREQLSILRALGCDFIQGYFFSKPLIANDMIDFLENFDFERCLDEPTQSALEMAG